MPQNPPWQEATPLPSVGPGQVAAVLQAFTGREDAESRLSLPPLPPELACSVFPPELARVPPVPPPMTLAPPLPPRLLPPAEPPVTGASTPASLEDDELIWPPTPEPPPALPLAPPAELLALLPPLPALPPEPPSLRLELPSAPALPSQAPASGLFV